MWQGLEQIPELNQQCVVTIGVFDGIHKGHQQLINAAIADANRRCLPIVLMTFEPNPVALFAPEKAPKLVTTYSYRAKLAQQMGVDAFLIVPFDKEFAAMEPEDFVRVVLKEKLNAAAVFVGENFSYGKKAAGNAQTLPEQCSRYGIETTIVELLQVQTEGEPGRASSTRVRHYLAHGKVEAAAELLGRPHRIDGEIVHGQGRGGAQLGFPTANINFDPEMAVPADGVYAAWFTVTAGRERTDVDATGDIELGVAYPAAVSVGTNVTFGDTERTVEAFVLDRNADMYGLHGSVDFVGRIRGMVKFDGLEPLIDRMNLDVIETRQILGLGN